MMKSIKEVTGTSSQALDCIKKNGANIMDAASILSSVLQSCVESSFEAIEELASDILHGISTGKDILQKTQAGLSYCKLIPEEVDCLNNVKTNTLFYAEFMAKESKKLSDDTSFIMSTEEQNVQMCQITSSGSYHSNVKRLIKDICSCANLNCFLPNNMVEQVKH